VTYDLSYVNQNGKMVKVYDFKHAKGQDHNNLKADEAVGANVSQIAGAASYGEKKVKTGSISANGAKVRSSEKSEAISARKRTVSRVPNMSHPRSRVRTPSVAIGTLPRKPKAAVPVASVHIEPNVRTINETKHAPFPFSIVFMAIICTLLFMYMVYNMVQINESTVQISKLKANIVSLDKQKNELSFKLEKRNDLILIEKIATEKLGMVKLDQVTKKYVKIEHEDKIEVFDDNADSDPNIFRNTMSGIAQNLRDIPEYID